MQLPHPKRWLILLVILAAECMDLLDGTSSTSPRRRSTATCTRPRRACSGSSAATRSRSRSGC